MQTQITDFYIMRNWAYFSGWELKRRTRVGGQGANTLRRSLSSGDFTILGIPDALFNFYICRIYKNGTAPPSKVYNIPKTPLNMRGFV